MQPRIHISRARATSIFPRKRFLQNFHLLPLFSPNVFIFISIFSDQMLKQNHTRSSSRIPVISRGVIDVQIQEDLEKDGMICEILKNVAEELLIDRPTGYCLYFLQIVLCVYCSNFDEKYIARSHFHRVAGGGQGRPGPRLRPPPRRRPRALDDGELGWKQRVTVIVF